MRIRSNALSAVKVFFEVELGDLADSRTIHSWFFSLCKAFLDLERPYVLAHPEHRIQESQMLWFTDAVKRLKKHEPIQYIIGYETFYGIEIEVGPGVLIPRPETEELVDWLLSDYPEGVDRSVFDWCTGSGCLALSIKRCRSSWDVHGVDLSEQALSYARRSASALNMNIEWHHDDLFHPQIGLKADILISNPPYVLPSESALMSPNVLDYEPSLALFVDESDPLAPYRQLAIIATRSLSSGGAAYFEINESQGIACLDLFEKAGFVCTLRQDLNGKDRMIKIIQR